MNFELVGALKTAYEAEKDGVRTYLGFAKQTKVAGAKDMFIQLALDEVDHMEMLQSFMEKTLMGQTYTTVDVPEARLAGIRADVADATRQQLAPSDVSDEQALKIAMEQEKKAKEFYLAESEKAEDQAVKDFFAKMAGVEQKHYDILSAELNYMQNSGFWFDAMEFSLEK